MSSQDQATSETNQLFGGPRFTMGRFKFSPGTLLIPVVVAMKLATLIPVTTFIEVVRQTLCRRLNSSDDGTAPLTAYSPNSPELCDTPGVARAFSVAITVLGITEGIVAVAGCGLLSRISSYHGRKPAFLLLLITGIAGNTMIPWSQHMADWLMDSVFAVGVLCEMLTNGVYNYLVNMYIVDVCSSDDRTVALSKITGWSVLGTCIPYALGGSITTKTGNPLIVFYISAAVFLLAFVYVVAVLPESFPEAKRMELSQICSEPSTDPTARSGFLSAFQPLKMLLPARTPGGARNWRLTLCAAHIFLFTTANAYAAGAWFVLATTIYHLTPADTGIFLTATAASGTIVLTLIVPRLICFLRPYYRRQNHHFLLSGEVADEDETLEPEVLDRLDVHMAIVSCVVAGISYLWAAVSTTNIMLISSAIVIGFVGMYAPTIRSLVAGSVDPLKQGEVLAAIEMVASAGSLLSPIVMGGTLTAAIDTVPLLPFYFHPVIVLMSTVLLFPVRDKDRYRKAVEA